MDRVLNQEVVDYINLLFMNFAVFNFADILVCTGIGLLCLSLVLEEVRSQGEKRPRAGICRMERFELLVPPESEGSASTAF